MWAVPPKTSLRERTHWEQFRILEVGWHPDLAWEVQRERRQVRCLKQCWLPVPWPRVLVAVELWRAHSLPSCARIALVERPTNQRAIQELAHCCSSAGLGANVARGRQRCPPLLRSGCLALDHHSCGCLVRYAWSAALFLNRNFPRPMRSKTGRMLGIQRLPTAC